ncbi:hypothetical protein K426_28610 (plasmid) [Sphingobium sp. TKS]|uniref:Uncharacterized protein n=1 Tax=Sphingomonas sp. NS2 TaxID=908605 RepID=A0A0D4ZYR0_9SPHN|nr:hypothetical protein plasmid201_229 [Sphingomonas sp. NS2]AMK26617.1 hypothetical protein K426_28610 [Sphingobium sp. TKS]
MTQQPEGRHGLHVRSADAQGIGLANGPKQWVAPWSSIVEIAATVTPYQGRRLLVAVIGVGPQRVVIVSEDEPVWPLLHSAIEVHLPNARRLAEWEPEARKGESVHVIFAGQPV